MPRHHYDANGNYRGYSLNDREQGEEQAAKELGPQRSRATPREEAIYDWIIGGFLIVVVLIVTIANWPH